jgi:hypothetical protein
MLAEYDEHPDVLVMQGLQYLHGFDMTYRSEGHNVIGHGLPGTYLRTLEQVAVELAAWRARCEEFDADPAQWLADRRREAAAAVERERNR